MTPPPLIYMDPKKPGLNRVKQKSDPIFNGRLRNLLMRPQMTEQHLVLT